MLNAIERGDVSLGEYTRIKMVLATRMGNIKICEVLFMIHSEIE